ncbi:MAG: hypothetical protein ACP5PV_02070 [Methanothrix sp.]
MRLRFLEGTVFRAVSGRDVDFDSCDLGIFDELRRFLDGSGVHCAFVSGYQTVQAPQNTLDFVCPARYLSALYPPGSVERRSVEGVLTGEEGPEDLIRLAPAFAHSSGAPRVGPTGLPRCGGAPSTPGRLGYRAAGG